MHSKNVAIIRLFLPQVRQRACVLWPVAEHFRLRNEHLSDPDDLWPGGDAGAHHHPVHPQPLPQALPAGFLGRGGLSLPADHLHPQR